MIQSMFISNSVGMVLFSHYFNSVPDQMRNSLEKEILSQCVSCEETRVTFNELNLLAHFRRERTLLISVVTDLSFPESVSIEFLNRFIHLLRKQPHLLTEKQIIQNQKGIHSILEEMVVHGNIVQTRQIRIEALTSGQ